MNSRSLLTIRITAAALGVLVVAFAVMSWYEFTQLRRLSGETASLSAGLSTLAQIQASTTANLKAALAANNDSLAATLTMQQRNVSSLQAQLGNFQGQVGTISGTVSNLQKLSQTDPQLLAKYSKIFFLNENYAPERLTTIPNAYAYSDTKQMGLIPQVLPHLQAMIDAATSTGIKLYVASAYRSFAEQKALKGDYTVTYGAGTANSFSADQGYSEHQLGTTVDLITTGLGGQLDGFDHTAAYPWLLANAYKYGFILSYPQGNSYYEYEPWHWRFVGIKLATYLHDQHKSFYDLDQRTIDTYLINFDDAN